MYKDKKDKNNIVYWPKLIIKDERFNQPSIFLAGYYTDIDSGPYDIGNCSTEIFDALKRMDRKHQTSVMTKKNIVFVCHSTGGIVIRDLLEKNYESFKEKNVGLVLLASPSFGSKIENKLDLIVKFYQNELGKQLKWGNWVLKDLDDRFKELLHKKRIPNIVGVEAYENHFIIHRKWLPNKKLVVSKESAGRYFGAPKLLRKTDHFSIAKPNNFDHPSHELLLDFYVENFKEKIKTEPPKKSINNNKLDIRAKELQEINNILT